MTIKIYGVATATCARVLLCLHEKGLQFELVPLDVAAAAHKQQPYLSLNPFGKIPPLEDGNVTLFESRAINRYVAHKHQDIGTDLKRQNDFTESNIVETWKEVEAHQFDSPVQAIVGQMIVNLIHGTAPDEKIIQSETEKLQDVLDVYEERPSKSKYLTGNNYTMADLNHIPYLVYFTRTPRANVITSRPHVNAWWEDISSRPAAVKVAEEMNLLLRKVQRDKGVLVL